MTLPRWIAMAWASACWLWVALASAQKQPELTVTLSHNQVEATEAFQLELKALAEGDGGTVQDPQLQAPEGFVVRGPSISTQTFMQFGTGGRSMKRGIGATWTLVTSTPGRYKIPGPTVLWNGKRLATHAVTVEVLPQGQGRARRGAGLLPGGLPGGWPFASDPFDTAVPQAAPTLRDDLALPRALEANVFSVAVANKKQAFVGEQVTVDFYIYAKPQFSIDVLGRSDPGYADFERFPLLANPGTEPSEFAKVGDEIFEVKRIDRVALFPLRAGKLTTGVMGFDMRMRRNKFRRESNNISIDVKELPPAPGAQELAIGNFSLEANVEPRELSAGQTFTVTVTVAGTGKLPTALTLPSTPGLRWLDPEKKELVEAKQGLIGGNRTFRYVVQAEAAGLVDLQSVELLQFDPSQGRYQPLRAKLGTVSVAPAAMVAGQAAAPVAPPSVPSASPNGPMPLPPPRATMTSPTVDAPQPLGGDRFYWWALLPPLGAVGAEGLTRSWARLQARRRARSSSAVARAEQALLDLSEKPSAAAAERAVVLCIEAARGIKARGITTDRLATELTQVGVESTLATRVADHLKRLDQLRFSPTQEDDANLSREAETLGRALLQTR